MSAAATVVIKGLKGKKPDFKSTAIVILLCLGVIGVLLFINLVCS